MAAKKVKKLVTEEEFLTRRQKKCAETNGHIFPFDRNYGVCSNCLVRVNPPEEKERPDDWHPSKGPR